MFLLRTLVQPWLKICSKCITVKFRLCDFYVAIHYVEVFSKKVYGRRELMFFKIQFRRCRNCILTAKTTCYTHFRWYIFSILCGIVALLELITHIVWTQIRTWLSLKIGNCYCRILYLVCQWLKQYDKKKSK